MASQTGNFSSNQLKISIKKHILLSNLLIYSQIKSNHHLLQRVILSALEISRNLGIVIPRHGINSLSHSVMLKDANYLTGIRGITAIHFWRLWVIWLRIIHNDVDVFTP